MRELTNGKAAQARLSAYSLPHMPTRKHILPCLVAAVLLALCYASCNYLAMAQDDEIPTSASMEIAKERGTLIRSATVKPNQFTWNRHEITLAESWLEKGPYGTHLQSKLNFDGKPEFRENQKILLQFREEGSEKLLYSVGEFVCGRKWFPYEVIRAIVQRRPLKGAYICRTAHIKREVNPEFIRLRVGTYTMNSGTIQPVMNDTVLTFDLK